MNVPQTTHQYRHYFIKVLCSWYFIILL